MPTAVDPSVSANRGIPSPIVRCQIASEVQLIQLFMPRDLGPAFRNFIQIDAALLKRNQTDAVEDMYETWQYTLNTYYAGKLRGGTSAQTQTSTLAFGKALYCLVGLNGSGLTLGTTPLDTNSVVQVVFPSSNPQTVLTGDQHAGVVVPGGTLTQPVTITITPIKGNFTFPAGPLNTKLDQYGPFFQFNVVPEQTFATPVVAAGCINGSGDAPPPSTVDLAHNVGDSIQILTAAPTPFLVCGPTGMIRQPSTMQLARNGDYGRALRRIESSALKLFTPEPAYAFTSSGVGGKTSSFSPFGGVDTAVVVKLVSSFPAQPQLAPAGSPVAAAPSVMVQTVNGHTPLGGASVVFTIGSGGGSLGPSSSSSIVNSATVVTDNTTGIAAVPSWTLGAGPANTLNATASFTLPTNISGIKTFGSSSTAGIVVDSNPVAFTATSTDIIPYQTAGYMYLSGTYGLEPNFANTSYVPGTGWQTGNAPFGSSNISSICPLLAPVVTPWPLNSDMLLRKNFTLPAWWTSGVTMGIAIDNDFQVFMDGTNVTPINVSGYDPISGFVKHENCATRDSYTFPLTVTGGPHLLAIRARDRGVADYVDTRLTARP
ncbi:MAG: hypothetical protein ABI338_01365 [Gemmatimonadaceae bacterium]